MDHRANPAELSGSTASRVTSLDTLRAVLVAWIIGGHALLGYSAIGGWAYDEINEVTLTPKVEFVLAALIGPTALFMMGTFFLVAGLFTARSLDRRGPAGFVRNRGLRLGVPFLVSVVVVWPLFLWLAYRAAGRDVGYGWLLTGRDRKLDSGALWFAEVLLIFSLAYVVIRMVRSSRRDRDAGRAPLSIGYLAVIAAAIAVTAFVVRMWVPARAGQPGDLHLWQWPMLAAMFALGVAGARSGLVERVPDRLWRESGYIALGTVVALPVIAIAVGVGNLADAAPRFLGGWRWESLLLVSVEGVLVVFGSIWLLGFAHRAFAGTGRFRRAAVRSSFAAFVVQGPVLLAVATALRPLGAPAEVKAVVVAAVGIAACFGLGWLLVSRKPLSKLL